MGRSMLGQNDADAYRNWASELAMVHPGRMTLKQAAQMAFDIVELGGGSRPLSGVCQDLAEFLFDRLRDPDSHAPALLTARVYSVLRWRDSSDEWGQTDWIQSRGDDEPVGDVVMCELLGSCGQYAEWCTPALAGPDKLSVAGRYGFGAFTPAVQAVIEELKDGEGCTEESGESVIDRSVAVTYLVGPDHELKAPCMPTVSALQRSVPVGSAIGLGMRMPSGELIVVELLSPVELPAIQLDPYRALAMSVYVACYASSWQRRQGMSEGSLAPLEEVGGVMGRQLQATSTEELRHLLSRVLVADDVYRRRLALDLHDVIASQIGAVVFGMGNLTMHPPAERDVVLARVTDLRNELGDALKWIRCMSHELYPGLLTTVGLVPALMHLVHSWGERVHVRVVSRIQVDERLDLDMMVGSMLYRIVQECLHNIEKHAAATTMELWVGREAKGLSIMVADDGRGFCPQTSRQRCSGIGLMGMGERIAIVHGRLEIESKEGQGTCISLWVPLNQARSTIGVCS